MITGRYAPSPSGRMHLGNLMCCLLAWLSAKSKGGQVLLRIEDLDTQRCPLAENLSWQQYFLRWKWEFPVMWNMMRCFRH